MVFAKFNSTSIIKISLENIEILKISLENIENICDYRKPIKCKDMSNFVHFWQVVALHFSIHI